MNAIQYFDWGGTSLSILKTILFTKYTNQTYRDIYILQFHTFEKELNGTIIDGYREYSMPSILTLPGRVKLEEKIQDAYFRKKHRFNIEIVRIEYVLSTKIDIYNAISNKIKVQINDDYYSFTIEEKFRTFEYVCFSIKIDTNNLVVKKFESATLTI